MSRPEPSSDAGAGAGAEGPSQVSSHVGLWIGLAIGVPIMAFAVRGVFADSAATEPPEMARWLVGGLLVHDLVLAPLVAGVGVVLGRVLGDPWRVPVRSGMFASAIVVAVAWAPLWGTARDTVPDNPSVQPLDYSTAVVSVLAVIWATVGIWLVAVASDRWRRPSVD